MLTLIIAILANGLLVVAWMLYLRRARKKGADYVTNPGWPSNLRPLPRELHDAPDGVGSKSSLYVDPDESGPDMRTNPR